MILLVAVAIGWLAGYVRAKVSGRPFVIPELRLIWLTAVAFFPQWLAFFFAPTRTRFTDQGAAMALVTSQVALSGFSLANCRHPAFQLLTLGLLLNFTVIVANGGLMPISPETIQRLMSEQPHKRWRVGRRFGYSKDRVMAETDTVLPWLSDRFILALWLPTRVAYSIGDVLIAVGACWFLWSAGGAYPTCNCTHPNESMRIV